MTWCKLYLKDSSSMAEVDNESVQLIVTVPPEIAPLGAAQNATTFPQFRNIDLLQSLSSFAYSQFASMFQECFRVLKPDGVFFFNIGQPGQDWQYIYPNATPPNCLLPFMSACQILVSANFKLQTTFIMLRPTYGLKLRYVKTMKVLQRYEYWFMFSKTSSWKNTMPANHEMSTVFAAATNPHSSEVVPNAWNEEAIAELIKLFTEENDLVLDPMCGTGTLGKVAVSMNRNCILYDKDVKMKETIKNKVGSNLIESLNP